MPNKHEITPNSFEVKTIVGKAVKMVFETDSGGEWSIVLSPTGIPMLLSELEKASGLVRPDAIRTDDIPAQSPMTMHGHHVAARKGGGAVLTLHVNFVDRRGGVSLPIDLPPRELSHLVEALNAHR